MSPSTTRVRAAAGGRGDGVQGVGERGGGDRGGLLRRARRAEPGLHPAGHRRLGQDQQLRHHRASTALMSRTARAVPRTVPVTLDRVPGRARVVGDVDLGDPPAGAGGGDRASPAGSRSAGRAGPSASRSSRRAARIGPMSCTAQAGGAAQPAGEHGVAEPGVRRPRAAAWSAGAGRRRAAPSPARTGSATRGSCAGSNEPSASITHTTRRPGRRRGPRRARRRRTRAAARSTTHGAERAGDLGRAVGGAVVGHDRPVSGGHPGQQPRQRGRLVRGRAAPHRS